MDIATLEVETTMLSWNTRHQSPSDMMPHPGRLEITLALLQKLKTHKHNESSNSCGSCLVVSLLCLRRR